MIYVKSFDLIVIFNFVAIVCTDVTDKENYMGSKFPIKYLVPENITPTISDLNHYIRSLRSTIGHFLKRPNSTDINTAVGLFYLKVTLKRAVLDDGSKFQKKQYDVILDLIRKADYILSHYIYINTPAGWNNGVFRISQLLREDTTQVFSLGKFNRNGLKKWILSKGQIHQFLMEMDDTSLPKEKYLKESEADLQYHIFPNDSDLCLSRVIYNPVPIHMNKLVPCRADPFCKKAIHRSPSIAYGLTHRLFNLIAYRHIRRCYFISPRDDALHMEILCAFMYREAVYLARKGYFARDLFMENVALCGLLGYEEFYRRHWFYKAASWLNEHGCLLENRNFELNRTQLYLDRCTDAHRKLERNLRKNREKHIRKTCHTHPTALFMIFIANAVRHAIHFVPDA